MDEDIDSQRRCDESNQVSDDTAPESEYDSIPSALAEQQEILDLRLSLPTLTRFSWRNHIGQEPRIRAGVVELFLEGSEMKFADVGIGDKDIGG